MRIGKDKGTEANPWRTILGSGIVVFTREFISSEKQVNVMALESNSTSDNL